MTLLDEFATLTELRRILADTDEAKLAVAFWGEGAIDRLRLSRPGLALEILCNLDSGACNPAELRKLVGRPDVKLKSHPALHAKVWWTPKAAVLGSSNASSNGLALEDETASGWHEANIRTDDLSALSGIRVWFANLFDAGYDIEADDLDRAEILWKTRARMAPTGKRLAKTLFEAFRTAPDHTAWQRVKVAFWRDDLKAATRTRLKKVVNEERLSEDVSAYHGWNEWIAAGNYVIDLELSSNKLTSVDVWKALPAGVHTRSLRLVQRCSRISLGAIGSFSLSKAEKRALGGIATTVIDQHSKDERNAVVTFAQAMALISTSVSDPNPRQFDQAMLGIYEEATRFGYRPTTFRRMIGEHGGIETARRLIRGPATSGFATLWEHGRLDLSVEALILRPEWRALFTDEEAGIARQRLRQYNYQVER